MASAGFRHFFAFFPFPQLWLDHIYVRIYNDKYIVQGFCVTSEYFLISAYSKGKFSRIYLYKRNGIFEKYVELDIKAHVGGITFDNINRILYVTGNSGKIISYNFDKLINRELLLIDSSIDISNDLDGHVSAATIYYYDKSLYICTCSCNGCMIKYDLEYKNNKVFVVDKNVKTNELIVSQGDEKPLYSKALISYKINWIPELPSSKEFTCFAKFRYRQPEQEVNVKLEDDGKVYVSFKDPQRAVTPGQFVVFYDNNKCLGGGIIEEVIK